MKKAVSLFTGCGGSDMGLVRAGFSIAFANDILPYASEVYKINFKETDYRVCPIQEIKSFPDVDLLAGCYPCQGFSQGGARKATSSINYLYLEFARALSLTLPKAFIVENVPGMKRADFIHLLEDQIKIFSSIGYQVKWKVLNAADYGVPQERKRIFIVGIRNDIEINYEFPTPTHGVRSSKPYTTIGSAISGMPEWPVGEYYEDEFHWYYLSRNRRRDFCELSKTIVSHPRHMPLHPISPKLRRINTDKWVWEHDGPKRRFSYYEAARLQGFGTNFVLPDTVSMRMKYRVVGNAVPPQLFEAVAKALPDIW